MVRIPRNNSAGFPYYFPYSPPPTEFYRPPSFGYANGNIFKKSQGSGGGGAHL